ncbi:tetratricopeptide repeat-containing sensor histidine kinase [Marivirga sp.]|uniref:tetratricopeptide repeat-containing sensor histidine kinase n=1 Tax=Marivirga sp. TaxID=2018662 RepID=UPI002D7FB5DA|nr:tetratricopeptide repeat-containing sensor histidine kinase [Marivirga sp.]HET8860658.1 tetratricopeptide repeat-containing sensor histidine kinase [Marivirga sp.]
MKITNNLIEEIEKILSEARTISNENIPSAISLTEKALFKSQKIKEKNAIHADALNQLSLLQRKNTEFATAKSLAERAQSISNKISYKRGIADSSYNLGTIFKDQEKFSEALPFLVDAVQHYENIQNFGNHSKALCLLGNIYEEFQDYKNAFSVYEKALEEATAYKNKNLISDIYLSLAGINLKTDKVSKAAHWITKCIKLKEELLQKEKLAKAYFLAGKIKLKARKYLTAEENFTKALNLFSHTDIKSGKVECMEKLGKVYFQIGKIQEAIDLLEKAIEIATKNNFKNSLFECHQLLFQCYKPVNTSKALFHLEEYVRFKEEENNKYIQTLVNGYEVISQMDDLEKDAVIEKEKAFIIEKKNTELDSFFYRVSHDLKGPIASLLGLSDLANKDIKDPEARNFFKMYDHQIKRLNMIVMELINITELNYREIKLSLINFYEIVDNCISAYSYLPNYNRIKFTVDIESNLYFKSEWYIINTILQNLIENSIKYLDPKKEQSKIDISIFKRKDFIFIIVHDNGQGIAIEHQSKIFDMFYKANENASGTGLGLFILKRAIERLKGEVSVESQLDEGSKFQVKIPLN